MNDVIVTKSQRGGEVRREWNGEGDLGVGGLSLHFCPGAPEFQVTPLAARPRPTILAVRPSLTSLSLLFTELLQRVITKLASTV